MTPAPGGETPEGVGADGGISFRCRLYFVFVDGRQVESLDSEVVFRPTSRVTFLRLTPLAGG